MCPWRLRPQEQNSSAVALVHLAGCLGVHGFGLHRHLDLARPRHCQAVCHDRMQFLEVAAAHCTLACVEA